MLIKQAKDFYAGLLFLLAGSAFAWGATSYTVGRAARMGPGYFPLMLGILLALLGAVMMLKALLSRTAPADPIGPWAWKPLVFIIAANLVFGVLLGGLPALKLPAMGLMAAIGVLTFVASLAGDTFKWAETAWLALALATLSYLAFIVLLKLQFAVWPVFLTA